MAGGREYFACFWAALDTLTCARLARKLRCQKEILGFAGPGGKHALRIQETRPTSRTHKLKPWRRLAIQPCCRRRRRRYVHAVCAQADRWRSLAFTNRTCLLPSPSPSPPSLAGAGLAWQRTRSAHSRLPASPWNRPILSQTRLQPGHSDFSWSRPRLSLCW